MTFDEQVAALRGKVEPRHFRGRKEDATPEQWAASLDYTVATSRRYRTSNPNAVKRSKSAYYSRNSESIKDAARRGREGNRVAVGKWRSRNRQAINARERERTQGDARYRIGKALRLRLRSALAGRERGVSAVRDLGCSVVDLRAHIEQQFLPGMTWENWGAGPGKWQIDHVFPLAKADLADRMQLLAVCNWRNLSPLWDSDNKSKGDTITPEAQALFDSLMAEFKAKEVSDA
jgi:hypothetical protein